MTKDELETAIREAASDLQQWRTLVELPQWKKIESLIEEQELERMRMNGAPLQNFAGVLPQEFQKGEVSGLRLARALPRIQLESAQIDLDRLVSDLEKLDETTRRDLDVPDGGGRIDDKRWFGGDSGASPS